MSPPRCDVRRLGVGDIALMRALNVMFGAAFREPDTYGAVPPSDGYLTDLLNRADVFALAALDGEAVVGGLVAYELRKFERERSEVYIYDLAVAETHRRRGIATALIAQLQRLAAERGVWAIYVQADHGDDPAIALYTKLGVREDVIHFDIAAEAD